MSTPRFRKRLRLGSATWWQCRTRSERSAGQYSASVLGEEPGEVRGMKPLHPRWGSRQSPCLPPVRGILLPSVQKGGDPVWGHAFNASGEPETSCL